ncbi:putative protein NRDE2 [Paratrimastix pyriformis]|uniref:Uncharacterized protein n=1 Tax=Paratrimastix pyriformis TaxID=342808 RepID=A0ABQ8USD1_9EUKA|nr:putative protein NRDE2 [Paratrimastix pyriformis]
MNRPEESGGEDWLRCASFANGAPSAQEDPPPPQLASPIPRAFAAGADGDVPRNFDEEEGSYDFGDRQPTLRDSDLDRFDNAAGREKPEMTKEETKEEEEEEEEEEDADRYVFTFRNSGREPSENPSKGGESEDLMIIEDPAAPPSLPKDHPRVRSEAKHRKHHRRSSTEAKDKRKADEQSSARKLKYLALERQAGRRHSTQERARPGAPKEHRFTEVGRSGGTGSKWGGKAGEMRWRGIEGSATVETLEGMKTPFFFDTKGDSDNLLFGHMNPVHVPFYWRAHNARLLGAHGIRLSKWMEAHQESTGQVPSRRYDTRMLPVPKKVAFKVQLFPRTNPSAIAQTALPVPRTSPDELPEFIEVPREKDERPAKDAASQLSGRGNDEDDEDDEERPETLEDRLSAQAERFNQLTRAKPNDVDLWIKFVQFQDAYRPLSRGIQPILEKKAAVYERALEYNPESVDLWSGYLEAAAAVSPPEVAIKLWERVLERFPSSYALWRHFVRFRLSQMGTFHISTLRSIYARAIKSLTATGERGEVAAFMMFWQALRVELHAGFPERALGAIQAMLEASFMRPDGVASWPQVLSELKRFWASEAPRIGEEACPAHYFLRSHSRSLSRMPRDGALGTTNIPLASHLPTHPLEEESDESEPDDGDERLKAAEAEADDEEALRVRPLSELEQLQDALKDGGITKWATREGRRWKKAGFPWRVREHQADMDENMDRFVLFEDIEGYLFPLASPRLRLEFVRRVFQFLGVPLPTPTSLKLRLSTNHPLVRDALLYSQEWTPPDMRPLADTVQELLPVHRPVPLGASLVPIQPQGHSLPAYTPVSALATSTPALRARSALPNGVMETRLRACASQSLESGLSWLTGEEPLFEGDQGADCEVFHARRPQVQSFVRYMASLLQQSEQRETRAEREKRFQKCAKTIMKRFKSSPLLWNQYARCIGTCVGSTEARKIWLTALSMSPSLGPAFKRDLPRLSFAISRDLLHSPSSDSHTIALEVLCLAAAALDSPGDANPVPSPAPEASSFATLQDRVASLPSDRDAQEAVVAPALPPVNPMRIMRARGAFQGTLTRLLQMIYRQAQELYWRPPSQPGGAQQPPASRCPSVGLSVSLVDAALASATLELLASGVESCCQVLEQALSALQLPYMAGLMHDPLARSTAGLAGSAIHANLDASMEAFEEGAEMGPAKELRPGIDAPCVTRLGDWDAEQWGAALETLWAGYIDLLRLSPRTPPNVLRGVILRALGAYPANPTFLAAFVYLETRSQVASRLRRYFDGRSRAPDSPQEILAALWGDMHRYGARHRMRALIEQALSAGCVDSPALWRAYVRFEMRHGNERRAQQVFFRALRHCPWSKTLCLDGLRLPVLSGEDKQTVLDLMQEKGLSVRRPYREPGRLRAVTRIIAARRR